MEALHLSAMLGHREIVLRLLDLGADISSRVTLTTGAWTRHMTPLMFALLWKRTGTARVLLERGASQVVCVVRRELHNGIVTTQGEFTALICAIHASVKPVVDMLLSQPNPMLGNSPGCGYSPLHLACGLDLDRVKFIQPLLDAGADPGLGCRHFEKPMCLLAQMTNQRVAIDGMEALLAAGANVDDHNESDTCTPLEFAAMHTHLDTIQFLLKNSADPNGYNPTIDGHGRPVQTARSLRWVLNDIETRDKVSQGPHPAFLGIQHLVSAGAIVRAELIESHVASLSPEMMDYLCAQAEDLPTREQGWCEAYETLSKASCFYARTVTLLLDRFPLPDKETPLASSEMRGWRMLYFQMLSSPLIKHRRMFAELLCRLKGHVYNISRRNVLICLLSNPSFWYADHGDAFHKLLEAADVDVNYRPPNGTNCLGVFLDMAAQRPLRWLDNNLEAVLDRLLGAGVQLLVVDLRYIVSRIRRKNCWRALLEPLMLRVADPDRVKLTTNDRYEALTILETSVGAHVGCEQQPPFQPGMDSLGLDRCPHELLVSMFWELDPRSLARLARVSKSINPVAEEVLYQKDALVTAKTEGSRALFWAARNNDMELLERAAAWKGSQGVNFSGLLGLPSKAFPPFDNCVPCDISDSATGIPLHVAAAAGHDHIVVRLLDLGSLIDYSTHQSTEIRCYYFTPLLYAIAGGHVSTARLLIERGACQTVGFEQTWSKNGYVRSPMISALYSALYMDLEPIVDLILSRPEHQANRVYCPWSEKPIHLACRYEDRVQYIKRLLDAGANPNSYVPVDATPLCLLAHLRDQDVAIKYIQVLLDAGADINRFHGWPCMPLNQAAKMLHVDVVRFLLQNSADPNVDATLGMVGESLALSTHWSDDKSRKWMSRAALQCVDAILRAGAIVTLPIILSWLPANWYERLEILYANATGLPTRGESWPTAYTSILSLDHCYHASITFILDHFPPPIKNGKIVGPARDFWEHFSSKPSAAQQFRTRFRLLQHGGAVKDLFKMGIDVAARDSMSNGYFVVFACMVRDNPQNWTAGEFESTLRYLVKMGARVTLHEVDWIAHRYGTITRIDLLKPLMAAFVDQRYLKLDLFSLYSALGQLEKAYISAGGRLGELGYRPTAHNDSRELEGWHDWSCAWKWLHPRD
ncbi:hypothetical protein S7711_00168 [Stachybotrys chartarum IBT 7711]|uniref:F-box domain-containing protein n=1 Tax=Stachybotrys chartarum (strain CBS 109288 / IBT 7711) TaxID=1280523 RepID=A0A084B3N0_STACB|nr:hypothetical protein S7711_00168 [Stachybotrys chartarum IBT 7711]